MNVGDLFQRLSLGDLSNISLGAEGSGYIVAEGQDKIVSYANATLTAIYSRFIHSLNFAVVRQQAGVQRYRLNGLYAVSNTDVGNTNPRYIQDSLLEPFPGDVVRIIAVDQILLESQTDSPPDFDVRLLAQDTIYVLTPVEGQDMRVEYQSNHPRLSIPANPTDSILLAPILEEALESRVAAYVYAAMNGEAQLIKSQTLMARYEEICQLVKLENLLQEGAPNDHTKLIRGGWV